MRTVPRRALSTLMLVLQTSACSTWQRTSASPARVIPEQTPLRVRVTLADGERITLRNPQIRSDSIIGTRESARSPSGELPVSFGNTMAVAIVDVLQLELSQTVDMPGQTVRVELADDRTAGGVVQQWTVSTFEIIEANGSISRFDWAEVRQVSRYRARRRTGDGLLIGALLGGVVAGTHAGVTWEPCSGFLCIGPQDRGGTIALAAFLGIVVGGGFGALLGSAVQTSSWQPATMPVVSPNSATALSVGVRWSVPR